MKLQKHPSRKSKEGEDYIKYEIILPKEAVEKSGFQPVKIKVLRGTRSFLSQSIDFILGEAIVVSFLWVIELEPLEQSDGKAVHKI